MKRRNYCYILFLLILLIFLPIKNQKTYLKDIKWLEGNQLEPAFPNCVTIITRKTAITIDI